MADGSFRLQHAAGNIFSQQQYNQSRHLLHRPSSPTGPPRFAINPADTPSPTRSPGSRTPNNPFNVNSMYGQNQAQGQHGLMNGGGGHHRFQGMQMNMNKPFHHPHQHHAQQHAQHHDHATHVTHGGGYSHQHSHSGGLSAAAPHYSAAHAQNGTPASAFASPSKVHNEEWTQQITRHQMSREQNQPHPHARNASGASRNLLASTTNGAVKEIEKEEITRGMDFEVSVKEVSWQELDLGGQNLKLVSSTLFRYSFLTKLFLNNNKIFSVPPEVGRLRKLVILDLSQNNLNSLPPEIGMLVNLRELLLFDNQLQTLPMEMGTLYQLALLGIEGNPLDDELKSIIMEDGTTELIKYLRENSPPPEPPNDREWHQIDDSPGVPPDDKFTALSYNILCEKSATQTQHGYTPSAALAWDHRKELILDEIRARDCDIVCLQELDQVSFNEYFRPALANNGYKGIYAQKSRAKTMVEKDAKMVDGCATFYKSKRYVVLEKQVVDIRNTAINRPDMKGETDIYNRVMLRDDVAVVIFLENRQTGARLIVSNVHVFWDPKFKDVKVVQAAVLLEQISKLADKWADRPPCSEKEKRAFRFENGDPLEGQEEREEAVQECAPSLEYATGADIPLLVCGDFNSLPNSGVYELISQGSLSHSHSDLDNRKYGNFTRDGMTHPFSLRSSYSHIGELKFTNYTPGFVGVLDYVFYSTNTLSVLGLLGNVDPEYLQRVPGFPNYHFPSDHLPLMVTYAVKPRKEKKVVEADFGPQRNRDGDRRQ